MSSERKSFSLGGIIGGVGNFIIGSGSEDYSLRNMARASISYAKPVFGHVSNIVESGRNSISESFVWKDYHRKYISAEEAIEIASTTAQEVDSSEPEEFKQKYEEKLKSRSQVFSYPSPNVNIDIDSVSQVISSSKEKLQNSETLSKISTFSARVFGKLKSIGIFVYEHGKEFILKAWNSSLNCVICKKAFFEIKKNASMFVKCCNNILLNFKNNPLEYPKRFYYLVYGFFNCIYLKIYNYRHPEVHKSRIASIGNSIKNIGFHWR
ncbi:hypothetical protein FG386_002272 [Cryptosporidium ryanae]|uniref:uncharacterized protein n=1 Tax=Cryptosporidium ryanae TaxID=515981 RepID=UPI00351AA80F|nr:hypothetical protein FG386_002272 [Cryptosporidium ryanae]